MPNQQAEELILCSLNIPKRNQSSSCAGHHFNQGLASCIIVDKQVASLQLQLRFYFRGASVVLGIETTGWISVLPIRS